MKYIWEPDDVECGRMIRAKTTATNNLYVVGYEPSGGFCLMSLSDGLIIIRWASKKEASDWLNRTEAQPTDDDPIATKAINYLRGHRP